MLTESGKASGGSRPETTAWESGPNTRGTFQIITTCLITINICVWTAIHLNIPTRVRHRNSLRLQIWQHEICRRVRWLILGLLAPEVVVYTAWKQYVSARLFVNFVNLLVDGKRLKIPLEDARISDKQDYLSLTHGFYAGMGAFALVYRIPENAPSLEPDDQEKPAASLMYTSIFRDSQSAQDRTFGGGVSEPGSVPLSRSEQYLSMREAAEWKAKKWTEQDWTNTSIERKDTSHEGKPLFLTINDVFFAIRAGAMVISLDKDQIKEKGKSNILAKSLVCLQACYMIVDCAGRVAQHLPLTFLEINTLGHVGCALGMYAFWLYKPQDIGQARQVSDYLRRTYNAWNYIRENLCLGGVFEYHDWCNFKAIYRIIVDLLLPFPSHSSDGATVDQNVSNPRVASLPSRATVSGKNSPVALTTGHNVLEHGAEFDHEVLSATLSVPGGFSLSDLQNEALSTRFPAFFHRYPCEKEMALLREGNMMALILYDVKATSIGLLEDRIRTTYCWEPFFVVYLGQGPLPSHLKGEMRQSFRNWLPPRDKIPRYLVLSARKLEVWSKAMQWLLENGIPSFPLKSRNFLSKDNSNWPTSDNVMCTSLSRVRPALSVAVCTCLYAGLHAAAWNSFFASALERILWRVSIVVIASTGLWFAVAVVADRIQYILDLREKAAPGQSSFLLVTWFKFTRLLSLDPNTFWQQRREYPIKSTVYVTIGAICILARLYLVVESFVSLRNVPVQVYDVPNWMKYIPHL